MKLITKLKVPISEGYGDSASSPAVRAARHFDAAHRATSSASYHAEMFHYHSEMGMAHRGLTITHNEKHHAAAAARHERMSNSHYDKAFPK
jgi:hypothetical protein